MMIVMMMIMMMIMLMPRQAIDWVVALSTWKQTGAAIIIIIIFAIVTKS